MPDIRYFHGGKPGLQPGDLIKPGHERYVDGCEICEQRRAGTSLIDPKSRHADRVYMTTDREYGRFYASLYPRGDLYVVEPIGAVTLSEEDHFPSLTPKQRRQLLRRWKAADLEALARGPR